MKPETYSTRPQLMLRWFKNFLSFDWIVRNRTFFRALGSIRETQPPAAKIAEQTRPER